MPLQLTAEQLRPIFEPFGQIEEVTIIHDKTTRLSKGCGFVTFSTEEAARAAIDALDDKAIRQGGKPLVVKFAEGLLQRLEHKLHVSWQTLEMWRYFSGLPQCVCAPAQQASLPCNPLLPDPTVSVPTPLPRRARPTFSQRLSLSVSVHSSPCILPIS